MDAPPDHIESPGHASPNLRAGMVAVVGAANAGKSSLINALTGEKVSIVSPVAQTTRNLVRAILTEERGQVVFLDTPGVHSHGKKQLNQHMNKMARTSTEGVDVVMLIIDRSVKPALEVDGWMRRLAGEQEATLLFVLNKCDQPDRSGKELKALWHSICEEKRDTGIPACPSSPQAEVRETNRDTGTSPTRPWRSLIPACDSPVKVEWREVSAETGEGVDALRNELLALMPEGPLLFPEDIVSDFPRKLAIGDVIREKFFHRLHQELPHSIAVWVEHLQEQENKWTIEAHVYVRQNSQKGMVIGNKGRLLKAVRGEAARDLHDIYGVDIKLNLLVKVVKDWDKNFWILRKLGYA
ncbi:MAG: GTPase Era [Kiritimatiellia bacterium]